MVWKRIIKTILSCHSWVWVGISLDESFYIDSYINVRNIQIQWAVRVMIWIYNLTYFSSRRFSFFLDFAKKFRSIEHGSRYQLSQNQAVILFSTPIKTETTHVRQISNVIKDTILLSLLMWARFEKLSNLNKRENVLHENYIISFTRQTTFTYQ